MPMPLLDSATVSRAQPTGLHPSGQSTSNRWPADNEFPFGAGAQSHANTRNITHKNPHYRTDYSVTYSRDFRDAQLDLRSIR